MNQIQIITMIHNIHNDSYMKRWSLDVVLNVELRLLFLKALWKWTQYLYCYVLRYY